MTTASPSCGTAPSGQVSGSDQRPTPVGSSVSLELLFWLLLLEETLLEDEALVETELVLEELLTGGASEEDKLLKELLEDEEFELKEELLLIGSSEDEELRVLLAEDALLVTPLEDNELELDETEVLPGSSPPSPSSPLAPPQAVKANTRVMLPNTNHLRATCMAVSPLGSSLGASRSDWVVALETQGPQEIVAWLNPADCSAKCKNNGE